MGKLIDLHKNFPHEIVGMAYWNAVQAMRSNEIFTHENHRFRVEQNPLYGTHFVDNIFVVAACTAGKDVAPKNTIGYNKIWPTHLFHDCNNIYKHPYKNIQSIYN